ncbi:unnamed protein product [Ceutorhynchus assimilis]|uniref:CCDC174 alpha/beta GRSR domain-containing protein n=1 Tax=Ceutorhynchus assimilis TaxID=467358 RepID=A0A9P0DJH7_9CUCU|nr:unnamed protein product [Ceutorhynchus assimilis]
MSSYEISKSSLISLKAEILRKQEELGKAKQANSEKIKVIKKKALELKNKGVDDRKLNDLNEEEQDLLKLSRSKLEAKSKLYDKLSANANPEQNEEINRKYLVRFDKKQGGSSFQSTNEEFPEESEDEEKHNSDYYDDDVDPSNEWVEYTDCLGRSRKCLRKDLENIKAKDADLKLIIDKPQQPVVNTEETNSDKDKENENNEKEKEEQVDANIEVEPEMISADMEREKLRRQWEQEEEELRDKTNIHYQNVLFNEARLHGTGYYAFSKDEEERAKQQDALRKLRAETEQQQKKAQDLKAQREKQMAARMKAARNRRRARLGLPPEEDEPEPTPESTPDTEEDKRKSEEKSKEGEKLLAEARKRHVRPWDIGKEGVNEFYQMNQDEWNEKKRKERHSEFAPPMTYNKSREFSSMKKIECDIDSSDKSLKFSSITPRNAKNRHQKLKNINPYKQSHKTTNSEASDDEDNDELLKDYMKSQPSGSNNKTYSTCQNTSYDPEYPTEQNDDVIFSHNKISASGSSAMNPTPIFNEVEEPDYNDALLADYHKIMPDNDEQPERKRTEIAPPPTYDYYGASDSKKPKYASGKVNLADSIEAGLKFLRKQAERKSSRRADDFEIM